jgi:hypothetical protein
LTSVPKGAVAQSNSIAVAPPAAGAVPGPLYQEFRGVRLGMTAEEVRAQLGKPKDKGDEMDYFEFDDAHRARVYYDADAKAEAIIATYVGDESGAPKPEAILGTSIEMAEDGSGSKKVDYPAAGYWVAYSRTAGEVGFVTITMKRL